VSDGTPKPSDVLATLARSPKQMIRAGIQFPQSRNALLEGEKADPNSVARAGRAHGSAVTVIVKAIVVGIQATIQSHGMTRLREGQPSVFQRTLLDAAL